MRFRLSRASPLPLTALPENDQVFELNVADIAAGSGFPFHNYADRVRAVGQSEDVPERLADPDLSLIRADVHAAIELAVKVDADAAALRQKRA